MSGNKIRRILSIALMSCLAFCLASCGNVSSLGSSSSSSSSSSDSNTSSSSSAIAVTGYVSVFGSDLSQVQDESQIQSITSVRTSLSTMRSHFENNIKRNMSEESQTGLHDQVALSSGEFFVGKILNSGAIATTSITADVEDGAFELNLSDADVGPYVGIVEREGVDRNGNASCLAQYSLFYIAEDTSSLNISISPITEYEVVAMLDAISAAPELPSETIFDSLLETISEESQSKISDGDIRPQSRRYDCTLGNPLLNNRLNQDTSAMNDSIWQESDLSKKLDGVVAEQILDGELELDEAVKLIKMAFGFTEGATGSDHGKADIPTIVVNGFAKRLMAEFNDGLSPVTIGDFFDAYFYSFEDGFAEIVTGSVADSYRLNLRTTIDAKLDVLRSYYAGEDVDLATTFPRENIEVLKTLFPEETVNHMADGLADSVTANVHHGVRFFVWMGLMDDMALMSLIPSSVQSNVQTYMMNSMGSDGGDMFFNPWVMIQEMEYISFTDGQPELMWSHVMAVNVWRDNGMEASLMAEMEVYLPGMTTSNISEARLKYKDSSGVTKSIELEEESFGSYDAPEDDTANDSVSSGNVNALQRYAALLQRNRAESSDSSSDPEDASIRYRLSPWESDSDLVTDFAGGKVVLELVDSDGNVILSDPHTVYRIEGHIPKVYGVSNHKLYLYVSDADDSLEDVNISWEPFETLYGSTIPDGHSIKYAFELAISAHKHWSDYSSDYDSISSSVDWDDLSPNMLIDDYTGLNSWNGSKEWDHSDDWGKWEKLWSSWDSHFFSKDTSITLKQALKQTLDSDDYEMLYGVDIRPVLVEDGSNNIVWEGQSQHFQVSVQVAEEWTATLNGTVYFPDNFFDSGNRGYEMEQNGGTWKIGLFETWDRQSFDGDLFYSDDVFDRAPVTNNSGVQFVATLNGTGTERTYELPEMDADSMPFEANVEYQLIVWFDVDSAPNHSDWNTYGPAKENVIDFYINSSSQYGERYPLEEMAHMQGWMTMEGNMIVSNIHDRGYGLFYNVSTDEDGQEINMYFHTHFHDHVNEYEVDFGNDIDISMEDGTLDTGMGYSMDLGDDEWEIDYGGDHGDTNHDSNSGPEEDYNAPAAVDSHWVAEVTSGNYFYRIEMFMEGGLNDTVEALIDSKMSEMNYTEVDYSESLTSSSYRVTSNGGTYQVEFSEVHGEGSDAETIYNVVHISDKPIHGQLVLLILFGSTNNSDTSFLIEKLNSFEQDDDASTGAYYTGDDEGSSDENYDNQGDSNQGVSSNYDSNSNSSNDSSNQQFNEPTGWTFTSDFNTVSLAYPNPSKMELSLQLLKDNELNTGVELFYEKDVTADVSTYLAEKMSELSISESDIVSSDSISTSDFDVEMIAFSHGIYTLNFVYVLSSTYNSNEIATLYLYTDLSISQQVTDDLLAISADILKDGCGFEYSSNSQQQNSSSNNTESVSSSNNTENVSSSNNTESVSSSNNTESVSSSNNTESVSSSNNHEDGFHLNLPTSWDTSTDNASASLEYIGPTENLELLAKVYKVNDSNTSIELYMSSENITVTIDRALIDTMMSEMGISTYHSETNTIQGYTIAVGHYADTRDSTDFNNIVAYMYVEGENSELDFVTLYYYSDTPLSDDAYLDCVEALQYLLAEDSE